MKNDLPELDLITHFRSCYDRQNVKNRLKEYFSEHNIPFNGSLQPWLKMRVNNPFLLVLVCCRTSLKYEPYEANLPERRLLRYTEGGTSE